VQFDVSHAIGIITDKKLVEAFEPSEKIYDLKVQWNDGEEFWCLEFTLKLLSKREITKN
jgi:hypothetical protein